MIRLQTLDKGLPETVYRMARYLARTKKNTSFRKLHISKSEQENVCYIILFYFAHIE